MPGGFWQQVLASDMALPADRPLNELTAELVTMLGSTNPAERDDTAYAILSTWLAEGVYDDLLVSLGDSITLGLRPGLGRVGDDTVFRRSFSALVLAECVHRDNVAHVVPVDAVLNWADRSLHWCTAEEDLRGYVDGSGWAHTVAHAADLITSLAESRHLGAVHLGVLLDVIAERVLSTGSRVLIDGEDDRLARAALTVVQRDLVETDQLDAWVERLGGGLVRPRRHSPASWPSPAARNTSAFLRALHVHLAVGIRPAASTLSFAEPPDARADLLLSLLGVMPRLTPWLYAATADQGAHD